MITAVVKAVAAYIFRSRVLLVFRTAAVTELAAAIVTWRLGLMELRHISRTDFNAGHKTLRLQ
jgi:hypothetical protein